MDSTFPTQNIISYCAGIRGIETGLERSGLPIKTIAFLEIEAFIVANLVAQMEVGLLDPAPIWTNIKTFDARPFRNKVHGIVGGYPCQPFSHAGKRKGIEDERHLFPYILEQIKIIGPDWVFFENVGGHLSLGYSEVRRILSDIGYAVEEGIFTAEEVGAPHRRERFFILGVMENASILRWRWRNIGDTGRSECQIQVEGSGTTLAESSNDGLSFSGLAGQRQLSEEDRKGMVDRLKQCSDTMVNAEVKLSGRLPIRKKQEKSRYKIASESLADTCSTRNEAWISRQGEWEEGASREFNNGCDEHRFPAGQGTYQHPWEEPRTIESSMVYTINGYNFTEDLHRAIGNSVVEQTAELAFISLLKKHIS